MAKNTRQAKGQQKPKSVLTTQSARFAPDQLELLSEAAKLKKWSLSQLIQAAAIEKAAAICNAARNPHLFRQSADNLVATFLRENPEIRFRNSPLDLPDLVDPSEGWRWDEGMIVSEPDDEGWVIEYDPTDNRVSIMHEDDNEDLISFKHTPPTNEADFMKLVDAIRYSESSEFAAMLRKSYQWLLEVQGKSVGAAALIDPEKLLSDQRK